MTGVKGKSGGARKGAGAPFKPECKAVMLRPGDQWITGDGGKLKLLTVEKVSRKEIVFQVEINGPDGRQEIEKFVMIR